MRWIKWLVVCGWLWSSVAHAAQCEAVAGWRCGELTDTAERPVTSLIWQRYLPAAHSGDPILALSSAVDEASLTRWQQLAGSREVIVVQLPMPDLTASCQAQQTKLDALVWQPLDDVALVQAREQLFRDCTSALHQQRLGLGHWGLPAMTEQLEQLRVQLGIGRWHLYGQGEYGVVAAMYQQRFPQSVLSSVFDSLYPPEALLRPYSQQQHYLVGQLEQFCRKQADCRHVYGDVTLLHEQALRTLEQQPLPVVAADGRTMQLTAIRLQWLLNLASMQPRQRTLLPWYLRAVVRREAASLTPLLAVLKGWHSVNMPAQLALECSSRVRQYDHQAHDLLEQWMQVPTNVCPLWQDQAQPIAWPTESQTPSLVLSGGLDWLQSDGAGLASQLKGNVVHVGIPAAAHPVLEPHDCSARILQSFWQQPLSWSPPACVNQWPQPRLVLDVVSRPEISLQWHQFEQGQWPRALLTWLVLSVGVVLLGVVWPLLRWVGWTLRGQYQHVRFGPLRGSCALVCAVWGGCVWMLLRQAWLTYQLQAGDWLLGLEAASSVWRFCLCACMVPAAYLLHQAMRVRAWRQAAALTLLLSAGLCAFAGYLVP